MGETSDEKNAIDSGFICGVVEGFYGRPWTTDQRKDLFVKMKTFGLNTFMYAPKDDFKHRAYWRELYSVEEADQLTGLIQASKESGIEFYYALSPGLDITYSNPKEVACLKRKLEQVKQFGCDAFALLFDDIEPEISETDKEIFQSFGHAQVSVTNEVYQSLGQPKFLFCPTEYCAARAVPNVQNSEYLNTIGSKLIHDINVLWTGNKVISKTITVQSIQELSEVLKRQPVIWDNLHANDYDQKRIFLGPYSGRSTNLIPHLRGVLTNPNCEYEPNFIAIHTLAQWSKCNSDAKCELNSVSADIKLESESDSGSIEDIPSHLSPSTYHHRKALIAAINAWLPEFNRPKNAFGKPGTIITAPLASVISNVTLPPIPPGPSKSQSVEESVGSDLKSSDNVESSLEPSNVEQDASHVSSSAFVPITKELVNSLVNPPVVLNPLEPMDCNPSPNSSPKHVSDAQMEEKVTPSDTPTPSTPNPSQDNKDNKDNRNNDAEEMQTEPSECDDLKQNQMTYEDLALLVDLFYLPFAHGKQGMMFLNEFQWLKTNSHVVGEFRRRHTSEPETPEVVEWYARATKFEDMTQAVGRLLTRLTFCKNRSLLYDLYPYVWDIKGVISLLNSYVKWLGEYNWLYIRILVEYCNLRESLIVFFLLPALGRVPTAVPGFMPPTFTWFSKGYKEAFSNGEQEPWLFRGGLTGELQRLLPVESVSDLFLYKPPESPSSRIYTIRPYLPSDEACVYEVCHKTCNDFMQFDDGFNDMPNLLGDRFVGGFLNLSSEYCFVVEDENGICGYVLAALDSQQFQKKVEMIWYSKLCSKYPSSGEKTGSEIVSPESVINEIHESARNKFTVPEVVYKTHPSIIRINLLQHVMDISVPKRLLACVLAALKANASSGVFSKVAIRDQKMIDFYLKLGFHEIQLPSELRSSEETFLGRVI
ncbi:protein O-GlcNAcase-like isoform X1 [Dinothrombium tinctorium]|uniref:protein O-GlcNAcase n=1 Tax=Dinothrombium tinctorium TaxID=1965070 RepID=A0A3S3NSD1_9ACAR|nr:protein O-GlcNAcase-like isoform X1 [Dinothrombium tinctorium]